MTPSPKQRPSDSPPGDHDAVVSANRRFYDTIANVYDQVDSRRAGDVDHAWVDGVLTGCEDLRRAHQSPDRAAKPAHFLDAGTGSGFLALRAKGLFGAMTLVDVSAKMLDRIDLPEATKICAEAEAIPLPDGSVDIIGAFATLHHLHDPPRFFAEAARLLAPGGVLYSDHDIEARFVSNFGPLLRLYRRKNDHGIEYLASCPEATESDYLMSEYHGDAGLSGPELADALRRVGFEVVEESYHWDGMGRVAQLVDRLGLKRLFSRRGLGPVIRLVAVKKA